MTKPMTQIIRELISANFPIQIIGEPRATSQFGVPYITFVNGCAFNEGETVASVLGAHDGQINGWAMEWIATLPKDHDVAVWRVLPEEIVETFNQRCEAERMVLGRPLTDAEYDALPKSDRRKIRWRLHTMTKAKLIDYLNAMTAVQDAALLGSYWPSAKVPA